MPINFEPSTPVEAYKAIIDQLVEQTSVGVSERLVRDDAVYSKAPNHDAENEFIHSLTEKQRRLVAGMLHDERTSAIHDVLAVLSWWLECRQVGLTFRGEPMPFELSGMGLHGDYVGRCGDWEWPREEAAEA
jgi:hypothetical protein